MSLRVVNRPRTGLPSEKEREGEISPNGETQWTVRQFAILGNTLTIQALKRERAREREKRQMREKGNHDHGGVCCGRLKELESVKMKNGGVICLKRSYQLEFSRTIEKSKKRERKRERFKKKKNEGVSMSPYICDTDSSSPPLLVPHPI